MRNRRRIPVQSLVGSDEQSTQALHLLFYLGEVERQASVFNASFVAAMDAAEAADRGDNSLEVFRHIQSALFAAIIVNRLVGFNGQSKSLDRRRRLRAVLALPSEQFATPIYQMARIRPHLEHVDERIDSALQGEVASITDWYLCEGDIGISPTLTSERGPRAAFRAFAPSSGVLFFDDESLDMTLLDLDMLSLVHNAREAQSEVYSDVRGRCWFSGALGTFETQPAISSRWREERARRLQSLAPQPEMRKARLWLEVKEPLGD